MPKNVLEIRHVNQFAPIRFPLVFDRLVLSLNAIFHKTRRSDVIV